MKQTQTHPHRFPPLWTTKPYFHHLYFTAVTRFQGSANSLSSSTYHTMGVKVFPLVLLRITFISHKAKLITAFTCRKTRKHTECEERLKTNRLKYKMSRCCFNTLPPFAFQSRQSIPASHSVDGAAAVLALRHPSLIPPSHLTLFLPLWTSPLCLLCLNTILLAPGYAPLKLRH